jgi:limonene-1,2-epoxide hydrolase
MAKSSNGVERRTFLSAAALGAVGVAAAGDTSMAAETDEEKAALRLVTDFCAAWSTKDLSKILPFLADDSVYRMSETTPPVIGHAGVRERLESWIQSSDRIEFKILDASVKGPIVINHRIDSFISVKRPLTWEGVGVFFVKDGKIKEWSDYTIRVVRPPV